MHSGYSSNRKNILGNGIVARTPNEDRDGKLQDIRHEQNHEMRSDYSSNRKNILGNPSGIRPGNDCIVGIQENRMGDNDIYYH